MEKVRIANLDFARGLAMACVILGHVIQCCNGLEYLRNGVFFNNLLYKFIYSFHLPLFAIISGWLVFYSLQRHTSSECLKIRGSQLLIPIVSLGVVFLFISVLTNSSMNLKIFCLPFIDAFESLWFLWALFIAFVSVLVLRKFGGSFWRDVFASLIIIMVIFVINYRCFENAHKFILSFYIIGYLANKHKDLWIEYEKRNRKRLLILAWGGGNILCFI